MLPPYAQDAEGERWKKLVEMTAEEVLRMHDETQEAYRSDRVNVEAETLWCVVNRYVKSDARKDGVTLFLAHGNGFPKEVRAYLLNPPAPMSTHD